MVIAEALAERKDLVKLVGTLQVQIAEAIVVELDGETKEENVGILASAQATVNALSTQLTDALDRLQAVENKIRAANNVATLSDGTTLSAAIVLRDRLQTEYNALNHVAEAADDAGKPSRRSIYGERRKKDDIKVVTAIDAADLRDRADAVAKQRRLLDVEIQKVNWAAEL